MNKNNIGEPGGFNYSVLNKKSSVLDSIPVKSYVNKKVTPLRQSVYMEDTGYGIYECIDESDGELKIAGTFVAPLRIGGTYYIGGRITAYKGERQLYINEIKQMTPSTEKEIKSYLKFLEGIDDDEADKIYEIFKEKSIGVIKSTPTSISEKIPSIHPRLTINWQKNILELEKSEGCVTTLISIGLTLKQAKVLYDQYGEAVVDEIRDNPYSIARYIDNYGFDKCDKVAEIIGYDPSGIHRVTEGILHILKQGLIDGHCYLPVGQLVGQTKELLDINISDTELNKAVKSSGTSYTYNFGIFPYEVNLDTLRERQAQYKLNKQKGDKFPIVEITAKEIKTALNHLIIAGEIVAIEKKDIYLKKIYDAEIFIARRIMEIKKQETNEFKFAHQDIDEICKRKNISLEEKQRRAVVEFASGRGGFFILNGSAGCGKTFTLNLILEVLEMQYKREGDVCKVKVLAPTGKASKVASEATGRECMTVHRGLGFNPSIGFEFDSKNPIDAQCIVIDETSMLDIHLTKHLLDAVSSETKVIFMGDTKQLASVGAGNILHDIIDSNAVKVITLDVVKRQGLDSGIIKNANSIINGEMIKTYKDTADAFVMRKENTDSVQESIVNSIKEVQRVHGYSFEDIQVLCPQKGSAIGTDVLNYCIQEAFHVHEDEELSVLNKQIYVTNPKTGKSERRNLYFKKGDKVIHVRNNYNMTWYVKGQYWGYAEDFGTKGIMNGEIGIIEEIIKEEHFDSFKMRVVVKYDNKYVIYEDFFDELEHAFALTIHKSQGSQWKAVIVPVMMHNQKMLSNNLFYTAYTRAQKVCITIGQKEAIEYAVQNKDSGVRFTGLKNRLIELLS